MGLFSSKKVITAGVSVSHIVDEKPDVMRDAVLTSVMTDRPISDVILSNGVRGFASKVEKYYKFGKTEYSLGLPEGTAITDPASDETVATVLSGLVGESVTLISSALSTPNTQYLSYIYLSETYGFDFETKKLTNPPEVGSPREFYYSKEFIDAAGTLVIEYYSTASGTPNQTGYITTVVPGYKSEGLYYNVSYFLTSDVDEKPLFWLYKVSSNAYPILNVETLADLDTEYLPIITLRSDNKNLVSNMSTAEFITAEKMAYSLSIDIVDVTENLMSTENGNDPNVIDSAFMVFAANIQSDSKSTIKYLYRYFKHMNKTSVTDKAKWDAWVSGEAPVNMIDINDGRMRTTIFYNYMETEYLTGSIGPVGKLTRETILMPADGEIEYSKLIFKKQVSTNGYEQFTIHGLKHISHAYKDKIVVRTLADSTKINENLKPEGGFFLPVSRSVALQISAIDRSTMYMDSLAIVVYTVQITKVKWYQRGWFRAVLVIIAIVYAVYTQDWSQVVNAISALKVAATVIVTLIVNSLVIKAFALAANLIGGDVAAIITTILAIYAISKGALNTESGVPWAKDLLELSALSYQGIQVSIQQEFLDMQREFANFIDSEQKQLEDLKEKYDSFAQGVDLLYILSPQYYFNPYETPDEFYNRTVETKNPGILSFDLLSGYFDTKLALPKLGASDIIKEYS